MGKGEGDGENLVGGKPSFVRIRMNCFKAEQPSQLLLSGIVNSTELPRTFAGKEENTNNFPARLGIFAESSGLSRVRVCFLWLYLFSSNQITSLRH